MYKDSITNDLILEYEGINAFVNEYKSTVKTVLEINNETAKKRGLQIEDRTKKNG